MGFGIVCGKPIARATNDPSARNSKAVTVKVDFGMINLCERLFPINFDAIGHAVEMRFWHDKQIFCILADERLEGCEGNALGSGLSAGHGVSSVAVCCLDVVIVSRFFSYEKNLGVMKCYFMLTTTPNCSFASASCAAFVKPR